MTLEEAAIMYNIYMSYNYYEPLGTWAWQWSMECGYQAFDGKKFFTDSKECEDNLREFLKSWKGPTK